LACEVHFLAPLSSTLRFACFNAVLSLPIRISSIAKIPLFEFGHDCCVSQGPARACLDATGR
jgi:hypothetical protein